jgi:GNAT superfamily N-acetyltransferase
MGDISMNMEEEMLDTTPQMKIQGEIISLTNRDPRFYVLMGPYLAQRKIARELGGPIWDDEGAIWFVALSPPTQGRTVGHQVLGFASAREKGQHVELDNAYVLPAYRGHGIYRALLEERLRIWAPGTTFRALTTQNSVDALLRRGFTIRRRRGQYTEVEMTIGNARAEV